MSTCPRCGGDVPYNTVTCEHCNYRLGSGCPSDLHVPHAIGEEPPSDEEQKESIREKAVWLTALLAVGIWCFGDNISALWRSPSEPSQVSRQEASDSSQQDRTPPQEVIRSQSPEERQGDAAIALAFEKIANRFSHKSVPCGIHVDTGAVLYYPIADVRYDVQRTNSLISPYCGSIVLVCYGRNKLDVVDSRYTFTLKYAYQRGQWVFIESSRLGEDLKGLIRPWSDFKVPAFRPGMEQVR